MKERNWAGNLAYSAARVHRPASLPELQDLVGRAESVRVLGARHSFNAIADAPALVALDGMPAEIDVDRDASTVTVPAGMRYGALAATLDAEGLALANLASLPHVSVGGAVATATHGSGAGGNLATEVAGLELVTSTGEVVRLRRGEADFDGAVVGLGALGAVTRIALDVEAAYEVRQRVFEGLAWEALDASFDDVFAAGYSVSVFTRWGEECELLWVKRRVGPEPEAVEAELFGARAATVEHHCVPGADPLHSSPQLGVAGPWWDRLPHFKMAFTPSAGLELQSEYLVPRHHGREAIAAVRELGEVLRPLLLVSELRTIAADTLWLSPQHETDTLGLHFTWKLEQPAVEAVLVELEAALAPFVPRPHWGKLFHAGADTLAARYPRHADFVALAERLDPRGAFANDWLRRHVLGGH